MWASPHFKRIKTADTGEDKVKARPDHEMFTVYDIAPWLIGTAFDPVLDDDDLWTEDDELDWMQGQVNSVIRAEEREHGHENI